MLLAVLGISLAGVTAATPGATATAPAELTVEARTGTATSVLLFSRATLHCDGTATATGFLRKAAKPACALVRRGIVERVAARQRHAQLCSEDYGGPQSAIITGTVGGRHVNVTVARADGCGIADWEALLALLGDPAREGAMPAPVKATATTTLAPVVYVVQRGDTLTTIARRYQTTVGAITAQNQLTDPDHLTEGQSLVIPSAATVQLVAKPLTGGDGPGFRLTLRGAEASEPVVFSIGSPDGTTFTGSPHVASAKGTVTTTYNTDVGPGVYTVVASGDHGTRAEIRFHLVPAHTGS
jgi:LysM repeat protein